MLLIELRKPEMAKAEHKPGRGQVRMTMRDAGMAYAPGHGTSRGHPTQQQQPKKKSLFTVHLASQNSFMPGNESRLVSGEEIKERESSRYISILRPPNCNCTLKWRQLEQLKWKLQHLSMSSLPHSKRMGFSHMNI